MRIHIKSADQNIRLWFPTTLVFNRFFAWLGCRYGLRYAGDVMKEIPPEAVYALFAEIRRIKKTHGSWTLVDVETSDGLSQVKVVL